MGLWNNQQYYQIFKKILEIQSTDNKSNEEVFLHRTSIENVQLVTLHISKISRLYNHNEKSCGPLKADLAMSVVYKRILFIYKI